MNKKYYLFLAIFFLNNLFAQEIIPQSSLLFELKLEELKKGKILHGSKYLSPEKIKKNYPSFILLDAEGLLDRETAPLLISKTAFVVNKPASFFNYHQLVSPQLIQYLFKNEDMESIAENSFLLGKGNDQLRLDVFYDSDDISFIKKSKVIHAVSETKKLDPLSLGAAATGYEHISLNGDKQTLSSSVINYISISSKKTLVIYYNISVTPGKKGQKIGLKTKLEDHFKEYQQKIDSFKIDN